MRYDARPQPALASRLANRPQGELQRLAGNVADERSDQPSQSEWNVAAERNRLALDERALGALLERAVVVEAPQKSAVVPDRLLTLLRRIRVGDFGDAGAALRTCIRFGETGM